MPAFEAALEAHAESVSFFHDDDSGPWTLEAIRRPATWRRWKRRWRWPPPPPASTPPALTRTPTAAAGWLEKVAENFPPQRIGARWLVLGTHDEGLREAGRWPIVLDAGLAFGSGEHS